MTSRRKFILSALGLAGAAAAGGTISFFRTPQFGRPPSKSRLERMMASPNWRDGMFRNLEPLISPRIGPDGKPRKRDGRLKVWWKFLFADKSALFPPEPIRVAKADISAIEAAGDDKGVWLGHSSLFLRLAGRSILIDPVFSPYASPVPFINRAFPTKGEGWSADDFRELDVLAISHDHWDHLDYPTVAALIPKAKEFLCPLGVGEYLEAWGADPDKIHEGDWWESISLCGGDITATLTPSRHFSGRLTRPNATLWAGFAFSSPLSSKRVYFSGDGGWGRHFAEIGRKLGPFDTAFIENGQYNTNWPLVHMAPRETALAATSVGAKSVVPIHNSRFALSNHDWRAPLDAISSESANRPWRLLTPQIGEAFPISSAAPSMPEWWRDGIRGGSGHSCKHGGEML